MKLRLQMPELKWRQETVDVPKGKPQVFKEALRARQERINQQLARRNEETARQLDKAARSGGMSNQLKILGVGVLLGAFAGLLLTPVRGKTARGKVGRFLKKAGKQAASSAQGITSNAKSATPGSGGKQGQEEQAQMPPDEYVVYTSGQGT